MAVVFATFSTWVSPTVHVEKGQIWDSEDPVVRSHPDWFTSDGSSFAKHDERVVFTAANANASPKTEDATADPGGKRALSKSDKAFDETASLREELGKLGVKVDKRWSLETLREEYVKATK